MRAHGGDYQERTRPANVAGNVQVNVQVFGRRDDRLSPALLQPAAEKRQGTKSRDEGGSGAASAMGNLPLAQARG